MQIIRNEMRETNNRLEQIVLGGIDEKIAMLPTYIDFINTRKSREDRTKEIFKNAIDG